MRRFAPFCFLSLLMLASTSILAATMAWALDYGGDSIKSQRFFHDSRTLRIIESDLGPLLKRRDFDGFRGVPYDVHIADARYVWSSSCKAHDCPYNRGFLWLDTQSGASIAAHFAITFPRRSGLELDEFHELKIGGSAKLFGELPAPGLRALRQWLEEICYPTSGDAPRVEPAPIERPWMERTDGFAYRCLPLNIANCHGWLIRNGMAATDWSP